MVSMIFAILATLGITGVLLSLLQSNSNMLFMLIPLGLWLFVLAPARVWKREREKVLDYERDQIEFVVGDTAEFVRPTNEGIVCRVGVKSLGKKTVRGVSIHLVSNDGVKNAFIDSALNPSNCLEGQPPTVDINDKDTKFFDVAIWHKKDTKLLLCYQYNMQNRMKNLAPFGRIPDEITNQEHKIMLMASGNDIQAIEKTFSLKIVDNKSLKLIEV